ncbi:MAG TPA: SWIM zinc finger family protein [Jatrophihabitans sp.]|nr:SWIM zinc finger family protein [Jatrophihabitans sp.]
MSGRWSVDQVLVLAPDPASAVAARRLAVPGPWAATGATEQLVWGLCSGSGKAPYQTIVDLSAPAYNCSCPSRKFPCKHAMALLLLWGSGAVPDAAEPADYAAAWQQSRAERAVASTAKPRGERDELAAAKRAEQRAQRVSAGLEELEMWLRDQVRSGLSGAHGSYRHAEPMAARMIDAQAPGVAARLRRLSTVPATGDGWPERLLAGYGQLHLLARAHARLESLPVELAATVRSHIGYQVSRDRVLAEAPATDEWLVIGVRDVLDATIPTRRTYLRGQRTGRYALVLAFDPQGMFGSNPDAMLAPGTVLAADLHYYPGRPPLRTVIGTRHAEPVAAGTPEVRLDLAQQMGEWSSALALDPWLADWPAVVCGVPVPGEPDWQLADSAGNGVPLLRGRGDLWLLAAVSAGRPVVVAGEWSADGFRPLTVWHDEMAVPL